MESISTLGFLFGLMGMDDIKDYRYERKFLISGITKSEVESIVKLHPAQNPDVEYIKKLINQLNPDIMIYHTEPIQKILEDCDTVLNIHTEVFPSTVLLESLIMGKPVMNISLVDENYNFQFIKDNAVMQITDKSNLEKHFKTILYDENIRKELIENAQKHLQSYLSNQGNASKRFAEILNSL